MANGLANWQTVCIGCSRFSCWHTCWILLSNIGGEAYGECVERWVTGGEHRYASMNISEDCGWSVAWSLEQVSWDDCIRIHWEDERTYPDSRRTTARQRTKLEKCEQIPWSGYRTGLEMVCLLKPRCLAWGETKVCSTSSFTTNSAHSEEFFGVDTSNVPGGLLFKDTT